MKVICILRHSLVLDNISIQVSWLVIWPKSRISVIVILYTATNGIILTHFLPIIDKNGSTGPKSLRLLKISLVNNSALTYFFVISLHWFSVFVVNLVNFCIQMSVRKCNALKEIPCSHICYRPGLVSALLPYQLGLQYIF